MEIQPLTPFQAKSNWLLRYKLYHIPFWMVYHYLWWVWSIGNPWEAVSTILFSSYSAKFVFYVVFQAIGVYVNLYFLIPRYLEKGKYLHYLALLAFTIIGTAVLIVPGYYVGALLSEKSFLEMYGIAPENWLHFFKTNVFPSTVASTTLAMSIKLAKQWVEAQRREQLLEKEKLETELKFLKSQFNPHFLFNTINSIFVLIHKNPDMASDSLAKFSDLLRYQLYECNEQQIPLERELEYCENFIELAKLRQDYHLELEVHMEPPYASSLSIAPFILMTFLENAFKHVGVNGAGRKWIDARLRYEEGALLFSISNSVSATTKASTELLHYGGIGLKNVERRLKLMYPEQYQLTIQQREDHFQVNLHLSLQKHPSRELVPVA